MLATSASVAVTPVRMSVTRMMALAESMAIWACCPHLGQNHVLAGGLNAAGVHQRELAAAPLGVAENAVPGDAGGCPPQWRAAGPTILLNKVDLPTLGRPTMATIGFAMFSPILSKKRETRLCFFSYPMF